MTDRKAHRGYCMVPLTRGLFTAVSTEDYERVVQFKWRVHFVGRRIASVSNENDVILSRFILGVSDDNVLVDHWNGFVLDNRRCNLRACTRSQNQRNKHSTKQYGKGAASRFRGVEPSGNGKTFRARIYKNGRNVSVGTFKTEADAARAYDNAGRELASTFFVPNFPRSADKQPKPPKEVVLQEPHKTNRFVGWRTRKSKYVGVYLVHTKWSWAVTVDYKTIWGRGYKTAEDAAEARNSYIAKNNLPHKQNSIERKEP